MSKVNVYSYAMMDTRPGKKVTSLEPDPVGRMLSTFAITPFAFIEGPEVVHCSSVESFRLSLFMSPGPDRQKVAKMAPQNAREFIRTWFKIPTHGQAMEVIGEGAGGEASQKAVDSKLGTTVETLGRKGSGKLPGKIYYAGKTIDVGSKEYIDLIKAAMRARVRAVPAVMEALRQTEGCELVFEPAVQQKDDEFSIDPAKLMDEIRKEFGIA